MQWYACHRRELPWRLTQNPYLIWVSEIILQQTRVAQGYDYFLRFTRRFPDVASLASAPEEEVMKYWQGLGYYSRARNLHAAARSIMASGGEFPRTYGQVLALRGVGEYTAAAICSFAYNLPHAVVDGNVYRVLARYFGIDTPIDSSAGKKLFSRLADEMLDKRHPADYNQAIMDFGALQCTPASPRCADCPLAESCEAFRRGQVAQLPVKQHKTKTSDRYFIYLYVRTGAHTLLHKRTAADIWQNLFQLPLIETPHPFSEEELLASPLLHERLAPDETPTLRLLQRGVKHVLSHRIIHADFYELLLPPDSHSFPDCLRVLPGELENYAVPRLIHAFLEKYL